MKVGDYVRVRRGDRIYEGILMPKTEFSDVVVIKLSNGYNVGFKADEVELIEKGKRFEAKMPEVHLEEREDLKKVSILGTGGTVASKIEYKTGAVYPAFSPEELLTLIPELSELALIDGREVLSIFSEDYNLEYWKLVSREILKEIKKGSQGIVVGHGTDTMHYTSAFLSFMLRELSCPVVLVGSQRSSDRPSTDSYLNLLCAVRLSTTDLGEVSVVMHSSIEDDFCYAHRGTRVRKLHTSRRDAFKSVNEIPIAKVFRDKVEFLSSYRKALGETYLDTKFEERVAILKFYPGMPLEVIDFFSERYRGVILEGTGLGHISTNLIDAVSRGVEMGVFYGMTSQCIHGRVNLNVYKTGRLLLKAGVVPLEDMLTETAFAKLSYVLGHTQDLKEAKKMMLENIAGEICHSSRIL
ncbi:MAG: Glu-tRNA(Gln) amidotransferase subunit GatD [Candidatus Methanofastidiosia archaeon]